MSAQTERKERSAVLDEAAKRVLGPDATREDIPWNKPILAGDHTKIREDGKISRAIIREVDNISEGKKKKQLQIIWKGRIILQL